MSIILKAENISKQYRLGNVGAGSLGDDLKRWWYNIRGKEDPFLKVGAENDRSSLATEDYVWALKDINFEVKQGEVLGIIGKNGAGKSTLLKLLSRVTTPTTGSIKTRGRIASLLEVGTGFHGELTGRENIFMNGAVLGMTRNEIKSKLDEIIAFSGCEKYIDTPVKRYSSGMTVRLGFAVAAHLEPEILVVDEVLAVGDADFQKKAIGKMQDLSTGEGRTVLFVSHNMNSIQSLCSVSLLLEKGKIVYKGSTEKAISKYLNEDKEPVSDLTKLTDRAGAGNFRFTNIKLGNPFNEVELFKLGEKLGFHFEITNYNYNETNNLRIIIGVYNEKGEGLLRFDSSAFDKIKISNSMQQFKISCIVEDNLTILPGRYSVNIAMFNNDIMEDYLASKIFFNVINDNYLGGEKTFDNYNLSKVIYKHQWECKF
ncbi:polysaccharide ABC transporter ATP-binding protein [Christiangramia salexigens]|uniref:ABC transporter ATP-binding protein n=1 Tax=Christiangramia salexigens TaxID=1913577 RepID=A0A1L3J4U8_9FLAO|nr:ABC transporter ATP-binding protein [Christiangramia salexigens]APG60123.1 ABC transporter ATP-binding protein [Christiangramia salexigens]